MYLCFFLSQLDVNKINNLRHAFEKHANRTSTTSFVCLLSNGSSICAELKSIGLNALNISWDGTSLKPTNISKILPSLDVLLQKSYTAESSSFVCSEYGSLKSESNIFILNTKGVVVLSGLKIPGISQWTFGGPHLTHKLKPFSFQKNVDYLLIFIVTHNCIHFYF